MFSDNLNALALAGNSGWAVGPDGKIVTVHLDFH